MLSSLVKENVSPLVLQTRLPGDGVVQGAMEEGEKLAERFLSERRLGEESREESDGSLAFL